MDNLIDQLAVIRVQLDELEKEIRGMMTPKEEEKAASHHGGCAPAHGGEMEPGEKGRSEVPSGSIRSPKADGCIA